MENHRKITENDIIAPIPQVTKVGNLEFHLLENLPEDFNGKDITDIDPRLINALKMTYDSYLNERGYLKQEHLSPQANNLQILWDKFDSSPKTKQIVGIKNGEVVSRIRITDEDCPAGEYIDMTKLSSGPYRESSRFIIHPNHRGVSTFKNMVAFQYHMSQNLGQVFWTSFDATLDLYFKGDNSDTLETLTTFKMDSFAAYDSLASLQRWDIKKTQTYNQTSPDKLTKFMQRTISTPIEILKS